ncbi:MAG: hypothetical protein ACXWR1_20395, partial [Bdellovibrionota bacterium]
MRHSEARNPRVINFLAYVLWSFPFTYVLLLSMFYNLNVEDIFTCFFSLYNLIHSVIAVATGFALYRMKPYAWHFYCFHSFLMVVEQFYVGLRFGHSPILVVPLAFTSCAILG